MGKGGLSFTFGGLVIFSGVLRLHGFKWSILF